MFKDCVYTVSYSIPMGRYGPLTLNIKMFTRLSMTILFICVYAFVKLNIHLTKSAERDHNYQLCLYMQEEHYCIILTS